MLCLAIQHGFKLPVVGHYSIKQPSKLWAPHSGFHTTMQPCHEGITVVEALQKASI